MRRCVLALAFAASSVEGGCHGSSTAPTPTPLAAGRWAGGGACLTVSDPTCDLVIGCGHGQFPRPMVRSDGTFDADGTYRIEAGPVSIDPAPPAHFSGLVSGSRLMLTVAPTATGSAPMSYLLVLSGAGRCTVPCV